MKVRVISALVAIAIVLPFIIVGGPVYSLGVGIIAIAGFIEMLRLNSSHHDYPKVVCVLALISLILILYENSLFYYTKFIFMLLSLLIPTIFYSKDKYTTQDALYLIGFVLFLGISFNSFILIREQGLNIFSYLVLIPIMTDTFALIFGSKFGKHKMSPKISPKKSWEGSIAGLVFGTAVPCIFYRLVIGSFSWKVLIITMLLSIAGQIGDLIFSKIKRENDIKDFSNIMPGHGGILDRLDSTIIIFMTYIFLSTILF